MRRMLSKRFRDEEGSELIEYAVSILLVLTMIFGVIEVGRLMFTYTTIAQAARAGARYAAVHGALAGNAAANDPPAVVAVVDNLAAAAGLNIANIVTPIVTYPNGNSNVGSKVKVTVTYPFTTVIQIPQLQVLNFTISSTTEAAICF
jgi:Flp pilus assembly protein TadG